MILVCEIGEALIQQHYLVIYFDTLYLSRRRRPWKSGILVNGSDQMGDVCVPCQHDFLDW